MNRERRVDRLEASGRHTSLGGLLDAVAADDVAAAIASVSASPALAAALDDLVEGENA